MTRENIPFIITFSPHTLELHKLCNEPAEGNARQSRSSRRLILSLSGHKSLDEDVNEYLSFRSVEAPSYLNPAGGLAMFLSFKMRH